MVGQVQSYLLSVKDTLNRCKQYYQDFRIYQFGSLALNRLTPKRGYREQRQIAYGLKARQRLDLFYSDSPRPHQPLVVFVHGGAWSQGDKQDYRFVAQSLTQEGLDVAVLNYHLAPEHIFPSSVHDLQLALEHLYQHQQRYQICMQQVILIGHSAGAFNVMSALYHPEATTLSCLAQIRAVIGLAGPYHFDYKGDPLCADAFDQDVPYQQVMPYYFVQPNQVQHYLFVAERDQVVHINNSVDFDRALKQVGNHSQIVQVPKVGHVSIMGSVSSLFSRYFQTKSLILKAIDQALL